MPDVITTAGTHTAAIIPEIWSRRFYEILKDKLPFIDSVSTDYQGEITSLGNIINIASVPEFSAAAELAEDAAGSADAVTITSQQLVINKRTYKDYLVTDLAQIQSIPFMDQLRDRAIFAIQKRMQAVILAAIVPSAAAPDHQISYTAGTTLALADILAAKELLDTQNVPEDRRICVVGAAQYNDLFNITGFVSRDFIPAGSPLTSGAIATPVCGFEIKMTNVVSTTSYFFHPSFMSMAIQKEINVGDFDQRVNGTRGTRVTIDVLWGLKQLDNKRVVSIA